MNLPAVPPWARTTLRVLLVCATVAAVVLTVYESRSLFAQAGDLGQVELSWCALAVAAETVSLIAYALLVREFLKFGNVTARVHGLLRATLGGIAMNNSLPAGQGISLAYWYKQLRAEGAERGLAGLAMTGSTAASVVSLTGLLVLGVALAGSTGPLAAAHTWIVAAGITVLVARIVFHRPLTRLLGRLLRRFASATAGEPTLGQVVRIAGLGYVNWLLDCACLWASLAAVHAQVPARSVLLVYGLAQIVANIPLLPGGGGTVEVSLALGFAAFSDNTTNIVAGVLLFRIINCWGLIPVGWLAVASGHTHHHERRQWRWRVLRNHRRARLGLPGEVRP